MLLPLRQLQLSQVPCRPSLYGLSRERELLSTATAFQPTVTTFDSIMCILFYVTRLSSVSYTFFLSIMESSNQMGVWLSFFQGSTWVRGRVRRSVKYRESWFYSCFLVRLWSSAVTGGKRSTGLLVSLDTQQVILIRLSSRTKFLKWLKLKRPQQSVSNSLSNYSTCLRLYCISSGSAMPIDPIITLAALPFSIAKSQRSYLRLKSSAIPSISASVTTCCISLPDRRWVKPSTWSLHLLQRRGLTASMSSSRSILVGVTSYFLCLPLVPSSSSPSLAFSSATFLAVTCQIRCLPTAEQAVQRHCCTEWQLQTGPNCAARSSRQLTIECSRLGGKRNFITFSSQILQGSWQNQGIFWGIMNLKMSLSLLASVLESDPQNSLQMRLVPNFARRLLGSFFLARSGSAGPISFFQSSMGLAVSWQSSSTLHSPLSMQLRMASKQGLPWCRQQRFVTSSLQSMRWNLCLTMKLFCAISSRTEATRAGSRHELGLMMATVQGRFSFFRSNSINLIVYCEHPHRSYMLQTNEVMTSARLDYSQEKHTVSNAFTRAPTLKQAVTYLTFLLFPVLFAVVLLPGVTQSLRKAVLTALFGCFSVATFILGFIVSRIDPTDSYVIYSLENKQNLIETRQFNCSVCVSPVKPKTRHCVFCQRCVENFDHHCKWLNNCVGRKNYQSFFFLLLASSVMLIIFLVESGFVLSDFHREGRLQLFWGEGSKLAAAVVVWTAAGIALGVAAFLTGLFLFHVFLRCKGITTFQFFKGSKISPFELELAERMQAGQK